MKIGSLFDGSGGFPLAGTLCGIEPVWAAEVEPYPIAVTRSRFPNMKHLGDISKVNGAEIEPVDIITFGSPCQDLSVAGKRAGLKHTDNGDEETTRSGLFMEAVRIIKEMRNATNGKYPTFALWENVPGAFSSNKGEDFRVVCEELIKIVEPTATMPEVPQKGWNYADSFVGDGWSLAYRVLDAQYWGVPQRRRRIYLVADFRGQRARKVLFERESLRGNFTESGTERQRTPYNAEGSVGADDRARTCYGIDHAITTGGNCTAQGSCVYEEISGTLKASGVHALCYGISSYDSNAMNVDQGAPAVAYSFDPSASRDVGVLFIEECGKTLTNGTSPGHHDGVVIALDRASFNQGENAQYDFEISDSGVNSTIVVKGPSAVCYKKPPHYIVRRLTPTECARLQGFPDRWGDVEPKTEFTDEEYMFWLDVRNTHAEINGKKVQDYTVKQMLTWYNKLHTDSAEYKMWGNGIALPCALFVMRGIAKENKK